MLPTAGLGLLESKHSIKACITMAMSYDIVTAEVQVQLYEGLVAGVHMRLLSASAGTAYQA